MVLNGVTAKRKESRRANGRTRKEQPRFPLCGHEGIGKSNTVQELKNSVGAVKNVWNCQHTDLRDCIKGTE